jgi:hypothetical protein
MPIGQSGGRSAGNRQTGDHRATQRERDFVDPPGRDEWEKVKIAEEYHWEDHLTPRGQRVVGMVLWGGWLFVCIFISIVLCAWWGLL